MKLFKRLVRRKSNIDLLHDQHLDAFSDEVVEVLYSKDRSMRYVILKNEQGYFTYLLEAICHLEDGKYFGGQDKHLPAMWEPFGRESSSLFDSLETLYRELKSEPEYRLYFGGEPDVLP